MDNFAHLQSFFYELARPWRVTNDMPPYIPWSEPWTKAWAQETVWWDINVDRSPERIS